MSIREARASEVVDLASLAESCELHGWSVASLDAELARPDTIVLTHRSEGRLTGFLIARCVVDECELLAIGVSSAFRREGIGRKILEAMEAKAAARGVGTVHLEVRAGNVAARRLYERMGYERSGERRRYYRDGEDAALYFRSLEPR